MLLLLKKIGTALVCNGARKSYFSQLLRQKSYFSQLLRQKSYFSQFLRQKSYFSQSLRPFPAWTWVARRAATGCGSWKCATASSPTTAPSPPAATPAPSTAPSTAPATTSATRCTARARLPSSASCLPCMTMVRSYFRYIQKILSIK